VLPCVIGPICQSERAKKRKEGEILFILYMQLRVVSLDARSAGEFFSLLSLSLLLQPGEIIAGAVPRAKLRFNAA
jgi:hypothetical protein